jgi:uncharacterized protein YfiM (DUF2279 family)
MKNSLVHGKKFSPGQFLFICFLPLQLFAQTSGVLQDSSTTVLPGSPISTTNQGAAIVIKKDTTPSKKGRVGLVTAAHIIGYGGTSIALYSDWYKDYPQSNFHFFNDNHEWKQVDKVGHSYSAYIEAYASMEMWRWAGLSRRKSAWIGALSALAYQSIIETMDGFSSEWGWSWGDVGANVFGTGLLMGQELLWNEQRIKYKFSFHRINYGSTDLNMRANSVYGSSFAERMIKDYNGQTYWLSANLKSFLPGSNLPPWLSVAIGYGADGMFGASGNIVKDPDGSIAFDRSDITRYRQYYISPDIDLTKIKTRSKVLKFAFGVLNAFKFPLPSIEFNSKGKIGFHVVHF